DPAAQPAPADPAAQPAPADPAAQPAPPAPAPYVPPPMPAQEPEDPGLDAGVLQDANATTNMFMPTALTPPGGTFGLHSYELFFVGASFSPTDRLLLSITSLVPLVSGQGFYGLLSAKYQVVRSSNLKVALHGTTSILGGDADFTAGLVGGVATLCLNYDCTTHASGYAGVGLAANDQSSFPIAFSGGLVVRMSRALRLLVELDSALIAGEINDVANGGLLWYGVRFASPSISGDVGFVRPFSTDDDWDTEVFPIGLPVVSITFRSGD
ncbi:MAG TPA: hypothetical protein PKU97_10560, partial [Kofleriaceae bacterium]|nr:hypothetical protein [Kofleriaceae bacterium]